MAFKRTHAHLGTDPGSPTLETDVYRSSTLEDRASTFIAFFSSTLKAKELQALAEVQTASHRILGWRRPSNQQSINQSVQYVTGSDDDGEKWAGKRVEGVLSSLQVEGCCVVARWYGGVFLGPVRFTHIEHVAREAVWAWQRHEEAARSKKRRQDDDRREHARLSTVLNERDQSIRVLRQLAVDKEREVKQTNAERMTDEKDGESKDDRVTDEKDGESKDERMTGGNDGDSRAISTSRVRAEQGQEKQAGRVEYKAMPLDRLSVLEKSRDATLTFLLKRIDKAERELASLQPDPAPAEAASTADAAPTTSV